MKDTIWPKDHFMQPQGQDQSRERRHKATGFQPKSKACAPKIHTGLKVTACNFTT